MSFSWNYLTRRFLFQNHRDYVAMAMIGSFVGSSLMSSWTKKDVNEHWNQHVFTDDESDIAFREVTNKTDGAVKRKLILAYREKILSMRAEKERQAQLDAFNYLNGKNLSLE